MAEKFKKQIVNERAKKISEEITSYDRNLLAKKYDVHITYVNHLLSGKRRAIRGKGIEILKTAEDLVLINRTKLEL